MVYKPCKPLLLNICLVVFIFKLLYSVCNYCILTSKYYIGYFLSFYCFFNCCNSLISQFGINIALFFVIKKIKSKKNNSNVVIK